MITKKKVIDLSLPFSIDLFELNISDAPIFQYNNDLLFIIALGGPIYLKLNGREEQYFEGDIALINSNTAFELAASENQTFILTFTVNSFYYKKHFTYLESAVFDHVSSQFRNQLLPLLLNSSIALYEDNEDAYSVVDDNVRLMLGIILDNCQFFSQNIVNQYSSEHTQSQYIGLMQRIMSYIDTSLTEIKSLKDFSTKEHLSENYLSHLIKKVSGVSFKQLLSFFRCKKSIIYLLTSDKKTSEIAYLIGFSSPTYFKENFIKIYKMTPEEYRLNYTSSKYAKKFPSTCDPEEIKTIIRNFADKQNIVLLLTYDSFFTLDKVFADHAIERFQKVLSDEGMIRNIDAEMNESSHQAFINMQKEFRMNTITIDARILIEKTDNNSYLTIANNINYLIESNFKIVMVIYSLSPALIAANTRFMKFYRQRFIETLEDIEFSIRIENSKNILDKYKHTLREKLNEETGYHFKITTENNSLSYVKFYPPIYDSVMLTPFAMDELFHPENWKNIIEFSLIDSVDKDGSILSGGSGLLSWNGIKKPWWHAYNLSAKLRGHIVSKGKDHIITNSNNRHITILTYNSCNTTLSYLQSIKTNQELFNTLQNRGHVREHSFQLLNVFGSYKIIKYSIDETTCLFSKWANLGYPEYLTQEEEKIFAQNSFPQVTLGTIESNGKINITIKEESFGVSCVVLEKNSMPK